MVFETAADGLRVERRDFYEVLGAEPSATAAELRAAFREAVLRHHPDRSASSELSTRRTSLLNRAWAELRDPLRRLHYDHALENGTAITLDWPLEEHEQPAAAALAPPGRGAHQPLAPAAVAQCRRLSGAGRGVPGRPGGAGALDR